MKKMKKLLAFALALATLLSCAAILAGCEQPNPPGVEQPDAERTQLYVGYYNGGFGIEWLQAVKEEFEKLYPQYQIMIDLGQDEYYHDQLEGGIKTNRQDMYIGSEFIYYKFIEQGLIADVTNAVNTPLTEFGEDKSIADKMNLSLKEYYQTNDNKYYAAPYVEAYHHLIYDIDLFDEYNLWFKDGGGFVMSASDKKSAGQDGEYGTWDDGLPVTYSDFFTMMDCMVARGITPMTWTGQYADSYLVNFIFSAIADYEGEKFYTNLDYDGEIDVIVNKTNLVESPAGVFELNDSFVKTVTITEDNFDEYMHSTAGKYFALKFARDLVSKPAYRTYNFAESHKAVQRSFLMSNMEGVDKPIAMLVEGNWWMNEADEVFKEMAEVDSKYAKENRRFGIMPIPKADDGSSAGGHTVAPFSGSLVTCISNYSTKKDIAELFFRFLHTDRAMQLFTLHSGVLKPYDYDLTTIYDSLHPYSQAFVDLREDTTYIYKNPIGAKYKESSDVPAFMGYHGLIGTQVEVASSVNPMMFFCDSPYFTAKDYLLGMEYYFTKNIPNSMR